MLFFWSNTRPRHERDSFRKSSCWGNFRDSRKQEIDTNTRRFASCCVRSVSELFHVIGCLAGWMCNMCHVSERRCRYYSCDWCWHWSRPASLSQPLNIITDSQTNQIAGRYHGWGGWSVATSGIGWKIQWLFQYHKLRKMLNVLDAVIFKIF